MHLIYLFIIHSNIFEICLQKVHIIFLINIKNKLKSKANKITKSFKLNTKAYQNICATHQTNNIRRISK